MTNTTKTIFISALSLFAGCGIGYLATKKFLEEKYQKRYEEDKVDLENYFQRTDEYERTTPDDDLDDNQNEDSDDAAIEATRAHGALSQEKREEIKKKLQYNHEKTTNYAKAYEVSNAEEDLVEDEDKEDLIEEEDEQDFPVDPETRKEELVKPPKLLSEEAAEELPYEIERAMVFFYTGDSVITDEDDNVIEEEDVPLLFGDCLDKYGFRSPENTEKTIFVLNYATQTVYEIQKISGAFAYTYHM